tara:strand:- start:103 stop:855 length:753 start_codon:yes stop_codon:yes gene_type:complete
MYHSKKLRKFKSINHCFFSRKGGFSQGLYKGLNCGKGSGDKKTNIYKNLKYVSKIMKVENKKLILMHQTHGNKVVEIKSSNFKRKVFSDAMITSVRGLALGVLTADCVPILIFDKKSKIIGCIHAGWKGALSGIVKNTVYKIKKISKNSDMVAAVGPCIGKNSYEVDIKFYRKFIANSKKNKTYFSKKNKIKKLFNLRKFVADKLKDLGVKVEHINRDTFREKENFYSYRRSSKLKQNDYGRCISVISLV